jgi:plasmid stabilization system protein ParE
VWKHRPLLRPRQAASTVSTSRSRLPSAAHRPERPWTARAGGRQEAAPSGCPQARPLTECRVEIAPEVHEDFERIFDDLAQHDLENAQERVGAIIRDLDVLEANPLIGRPAASVLRRSQRPLYAGTTRQYSRTAESKYQVRRISITSNSLASAGGNAG